MSQLREKTAFFRHAEVLKLFDSLASEIAAIHEEEQALCSGMFELLPVIGASTALTNSAGDSTGAGVMKWVVRSMIVVSCLISAAKQTADF